MTDQPDLPVPDRARVSIIIPCYNGSKFIRATLESALGQTRLPHEIIVIDDGSTDDSAAIAESFGPPVRVIRQKNQGESVARNRGLGEAVGTHVLFLDADDLLWPESLERLSSAAETRPGAVAIMGCGWFTADPATPERELLPQFDTFYPHIIEQNFGPPLCWLTPVSLLRSAGGFCETMQWFEDWDLWWRIGLDEPPLVKVPYIGARYRQHAKSQLSTTSPANRARGHAALMTRLTRAVLERPELRDNYGDHAFWCGWTALKRTRETGVPPSETSELAAHVVALAHTGPEQLRRSLTARIVRFLGLKIALAVR